MSSISSFFPTKFLGSMHPRDRVDTPLARLRFALDTMPGSRKYVFTPATRAEILSKLYDSFWDQYAHLFLPNSNSSLPLHAMLGEVQQKASGSKEPIVTPGRPCGHIFKKGESCFRCKDCALDDSCVLCSDCFEATDHSDHNVSFFIAQQSGGCCDCGDIEAWRQSIDCPYHMASLDTSAYLHEFTIRTIQTPPRIPPRVIPASEVPQVKNYVDRAPIPPELHESMRMTVGYALDYILDTLDYSPEEATAPGSESELRAQMSGDPMMMKDNYCVVLWNDDKHSFDEVDQILHDHLNKSFDEAREITNRIDEHGREVIEMNGNIARLVELGQTMAQIDLGITIRRAYDTFREQVCAVIIEWLLDLTRSRVGSDYVTIREILAAELLSPRKPNCPHPHPAMDKYIADIADPSRIDWMFLYHARLWKKPRLNLKEVYACLLTLSHEHKLAISSHFANVYNRVIDAYLLVDREAETSIKYFALQLFTVPSVALYIVRHHNMISRLLAIITSFFTNQIDKDKKRIVSAPNLQAQIDVDAFPFKSKRFMPVFSDLRYLCHNEPVQQLIAHNREFILQFSKTCQLFMCVNPNRRAVSNHVEYETDAWISVFNVTLSLSRVIKVYGEAFSRSSVAELISAITTVMHHILMVSAVVDDQRDQTRFPPVSFHDVEFGEVTYDIVQFDVMDGWVSFHHALQWLLAELFKHVDILSEWNLAEVGLRSVRDVCLRNASVQAIQTIIDLPLRVLTMVAQIRTGLWVRNGFAIRGQLIHYRDFMLRELCYDQDLFLLQCALIILDPNLVLVTMLDRFQLVAYFSGATMHQTYDTNHLSAMVEEVLFVIITILTESANATKLPLPQVIRREIIHALAVGPCTFTDLTKRVPERLTDDIHFERVLNEVANFRAPESVSDSGLYELKDEFYEEISPFFFHYTRNKREEVEGVLRSRLQKRTGLEDPVVVPKPIGITLGPFSTIPSVFESEVLLQIMFYGVHNILTITDNTGSAPQSSEAVLDQSLHLIMLAIIERPHVFSQLAVYKTFEQELSLLGVLCTLEHHPKFSKGYKGRVVWVLQQLAQYQPNEVVAQRFVPEPNEIQDPEEAKKRAAKARQEAIMRQMKAQQAQFEDTFGDLDDEDSDDLTDTPEVPVSYGTCIVCQEELNTLKPFGSLGFLQPSRLLRRYPDTPNTVVNDVLLAPETLDRSSHVPVDTTFPPKLKEVHAKLAPGPRFDGFSAQHTKFGLHASICSHMMHLECFTVYSGSIRQRHRAQATRNHPESIPRKEYICPLCKSLGNVILPVSLPQKSVELNSTPFSDWIRAAGISILKSKPDPALEALQFRNGTGEFVFWAAQDHGYQPFIRTSDRQDSMEVHKMVDTVMVVAKTISQQTRHLRDRPEPESGERGSGLYLPEELVGYTVSCLEVAQRGIGSPGSIVADSLTDSQSQMIRGLVACLTKLAALNFKGRPDEGRDAVKQAIVKRLLPEWSRTTFTSFAYPLLLRDPFTILVETAAVAPDMLRHVLVLTYYACLARSVIGLLYILSRARNFQTASVGQRVYEDIFGDVRMFFMSVIRPSPAIEHVAELAFQTFGDARIEKVLYTFTLPFLRRAAILCRAVLPHAFPTPTFTDEACEYRRLLKMLDIPPLSDLPNQDTLQNALSGWCAHYGHSPAAAQLNCGVSLDYPIIYQIAKLPLILDTLFNNQDQNLWCPRCLTVPQDAAICLICGVTCCLQSHCCMDLANQRGECNWHTRECAGPIGMYFLVKRCSLLYIYANNGTFAQSPYLDVHGEVDGSMRRGRRQFLHHARWEEVRRLWLSHGLPTLIARKLEGTVDNGGWESL